MVNILNENFQIPSSISLVESETPTDFTKHKKRKKNRQKKTFIF